MELADTEVDNLKLAVGALTLSVMHSSCHSLTAHSQPAYLRLRCRDYRLNKVNAKPDSSNNNFRLEYNVAAKSRPPQSCSDSLLFLQSSRNEVLTT